MIPSEVIVIVILFGLAILLAFFLINNMCRPNYYKIINI